MSPADPHPTAPSPADRDALTRARTERQMAMLDRLAEIGMEIAEAAGRQARVQAEGGAAEGADPGLTYSRAARAVRLTIALQTRLTEGLAALDEAQRIARVGEAGRRRHRIHRLIETGAEAEGCDAEAAERLSSEAWERLTETEDDDLLDRPLEAVVAAICRDLGLGADWAAAFAAPEEGPPVGFADHDPLGGFGLDADRPGRRPTEGARPPPALRDLAPAPA